MKYKLSLLILLATILSVALCIVINKPPTVKTFNDNSIQNSPEISSDAITLQGLTNFMDKVNRQYIYNNIDTKEKYKNHNLKDNTTGIPVLYYHSIQKSGSNELMMDPKLFRSHLQWLKNNNYVSLTMDELYSYLKFNTKIPENSVVITFDDGYLDNHTNAMPLLKEFGYDSTVFMVSSFTGNENFLTIDNLKELDKNNVFIESHSNTHPKLSELSFQEQKNELETSKNTLENYLCRKVEYIAYPYGSYNENTLKLSQDIGYKLGLSTDSGWANGSSPLYAVPRVYMSDFYDLDEFINRVTNPNYE